MKNTGLTDNVLKIVTRRLSDIGDKVEALGYHLNVDNNLMNEIRQRHSGTQSIVYSMLKIWKRNTPDASQAELEHTIDEFMTSQQVLENSRLSMWLSYIV